MGMNGPVRGAPAERMYPVTAMGAYTVNNVVDVEGFCRDNNMTPTKLLIMQEAQPQGTQPIVSRVDFAPIGRATGEHYVTPLLIGVLHEVAVKTVYLATTTATEVFILGLNP